MSTLTKPAMPAIFTPIDLQNGDRMNREEFHRAYERAPRHFRAELIGGIVYVASPLRLRHSNHHAHLGMLFSLYELNTPGTQSGDNATIILGDESEPQPDLFLRILPEFGGRSSTDQHDYVRGAPELIAEVAHSSRSIDLHVKREDYARNGVGEYLVMSLADRRLFWFNLPTSQEWSADPDGIIRVRSFPGFWIDVDALFSVDGKRLIGTLQRGLDSAEHAEFVSRLATAKKIA
jgi:Uma2 family endonuclease